MGQSSTLGAKKKIIKKSPLAASEIKTSGNMKILCFRIRGVNMGEGRAMVEEVESALPLSAVRLHGLPNHSLPSPVK